MPEKLPPHDIDAEDAVIGSLLIDGTAIEKVADILQSKDFYQERHQWLYEACLALYQRDEAINQITVAHELDSRGRLANNGGVAFLSYLISVCPTSLDIEYYAEIVHRLSVMRSLITLAGQIATIGYDANRNVPDAIDEARTLLDSVKPMRSRYLELSNLRIIKSKPPHYIVSVNGEDMNLNLGELQAWGKFRTKVLAERDFIPVKPKNWDGLINKLLDQAKKIEAPVDTSLEVEIKLLIKEWFDKRQEGTEYTDLQSGCYAVVPYRGKETNFEQKEYWAFQPMPILRWLKRNNKSITRDSLWAMMLDWGVIKWQWRIGKGKSLPVKLWALPPNFAEEAEFALEKEEEQQELPTLEEKEEELPDF